MIVFKFLFSGVFAHRVGKPPTYGGGGPRSGGEGGLQLYNAVFVMYVHHAPTVTPLARHLPREWEALSNTAKQEFICIIPVRNPISIPFCSAGMQSWIGGIRNRTEAPRAKRKSTARCKSPKNRVTSESAPPLSARGLCARRASSQSLPGFRDKIHSTPAVERHARLLLFWNFFLSKKEKSASFPPW